MSATIIEAIIGNHLDDSNRSILVAIEENDKSNFVGRPMSEAKSMLEFVGIKIDEHEFAMNIRVAPIHLGAIMQQDVAVIETAFNHITNILK
jgi:hypothetical protein